MQEQPRSDREWDHWPGRRPPDDRIRHRLRSLFSPTDHVAEGVEALIAERGRELEERTRQLAATISDLERREETTRRLRVAVEEMLRRGSAELDERHADLNALAARLGERDAELAAAESEVEERRRELGAVELRRAAVERRETAAQERENELEPAAAELAQRARKLEVAAAEIDLRLAQARELEQALSAEREMLDVRQATLGEAVGELEARVRHLTAAEAALAERERRVADLEERARELRRQEADLEAHKARLSEHHEAIEAGRGELARAVAAVSGELRLPGKAQQAAAEQSSHLLLVPGDRYQLEEAPGPAPDPGTVLQLGETTFAVMRVGPSPFPGDSRRCAYLEPADAPATT